MIREYEHALDALARRQRVVSDNLANLNTPGFTRSDVDFQTYMRAVLDGAKPMLEVTADTESPVRLDGNNVSIERELFALTQTDLLFQTVSRLTTDELRSLNYVVTDGRG
jgi:flagellar basal-body rod protein FlgB